ncbi:MAG: CoA pyrophosphatase [Bacteroidota bacterium]
MSALREKDVALLTDLRRRLATEPLPGATAQQTMAPKFRGTYADPPPSARRASVLALLYPVKGVLTILYIQRTSPANDRHAGQISFPGGSVEAEDQDAQHTALREAEEEVGVNASAVEILGGLSQLYIPVSNFLVDPFVGFTPERPDFVLQASEVARILELPLRDFLVPDARRVGERKLAGGMRLKDTPYWFVSEEEIWGATAMMTGELVALLR